MLRGTSGGRTTKLRKDMSGQVEEMSSPRSREASNAAAAAFHVRQDDWCRPKKGKCLAWQLLDADGREVVEARQCVNWVAMLLTTWRHRRGGIVKLDAAREGPM
eukprot:9595267-Heterocapsa_arctica.AAC.1